MNRPAASSGGGAASRGAGYRWAILAVGVGAQAALSAVQMGLPSLGPALRDEFGLSLSGVGLVLAAVSWGVMATLLAWGALADRIGERIVIGVGLGGASVALTAAAFSSGAGTFVAALVLAGAFGAGAASASGRAVMGWFGRGERGMALGVRQMAVPLGGALASLTLPALAVAGGLQAAMLALAGGAAAGALAAAAWMREPPPPPPDRPKVTAPPPLRDRRVWRLSAGSALLVSAQVAITSFVVIFLHDHRDVAVATAAAGLAAIQLGGGVSRIVVGRRSDLGGRRIVPLRRQGLAMAGAIAATALLVNAPLALLAPVLLVAGVLTMSWNGLSFTAAAEMAGRERAGTALGLQGTIMRIPSAVAGIAFGALVAQTSWGLAFAVLTVLPLAGWWLLRPLEGEEEERIRARAARLARVQAANAEAG
jgi:sugar phosphate permease